MTSLLSRESHFRTGGPLPDLERWARRLRPRTPTRIAAFVRNLGRPPDWHERAACQGMDDQVFYGEDGAASVLSTHELAYARSICGPCPVRRECLTWALETDDRYGVKAGTTGRQRREMRREITAGRLVKGVVNEYLAQAAGQEGGEEGGEEGAPTQASTAQAEGPA